VLASVAVAAMGSSAAAQDDWLDDMPSVAAVAHAVRDEVGVHWQPQGATADDPDNYAVRLAGTFAMLRWFMLFEALRETNPTPLPGVIAPLREPKMTKQRSDRMDAKAVEYRQVELAIERGIGKRAGYIKKECDRKDSYLNIRGGMMFATPQDCYRWKYGGGVNGSKIQFTWRQAIFPRLFCNKGKRYHERYQEYFADDSFTQRGNPGPRPHNYAYLRVKQWPVIAQPQSTAAVCAAHGGDANGDGLCDGWQGASTPTSTPSCAQPPEPVSLLRVRQVDAVTVRIEYSSAKVLAHAPTLALWRLDKNNQQQSLIASTVVLPTPVSTDPTKQVALLRTQPGALDVVVSKPNLGVYAGPNGKFGDVWCRQATPVPSLVDYRADLSASLVGIYGPYNTPDEAAEAVELPSRYLGDANSYRWFQVYREALGYIIRDTRTKNAQYYATLPVLGPSTDFTNPFANPGASGKDFERSFDGSFAFSCRDPGDFKRFAAFHTHPTYLVFNNNFFSGGDWQGFPIFLNQLHWPSAQGGASVAGGHREGFYLFRADRCIDYTDGLSNAKSIGPKVNNKGAACVPDSKCRNQPNSFWCT
jgi:hypothetical protein